jgi:hypothetical protein
LPTQLLKLLNTKLPGILQLCVLLTVWSAISGTGLLGMPSVVFADDTIAESAAIEAFEDEVIKDEESIEAFEEDSSEDAESLEDFDEGSSEEDSSEFDEDWDEGFDEDWDDEFDEDEESVSSSSPFTWRFESAFKNIIQTDRELYFEDAWKKNEISALFEFTYGDSDDYLFSVTGLYFFPTFINDTIGDDYVYSSSSKTYRNLRISSSSSEVIFREFYYNWSRDKYRVRIGNQIFGWGTADFINSTSYFNPSDFRELLFKDEDQVALGVPSVSSLFFFENFTVETVFVPIHTAAAFPETGNYWSVKMVEDSYPLIFGDENPMEANSKNFGYGARAASTWEGMDFSFSGYHGPDNEPVILPLSTVLIENQTVSLLVEPQYFIVDYLGFDFAFTYEDFVFQVEAAYSPNKSGFIQQDMDRPQDLTFPFDTRKTDYLSYSVGFNYFIPLQKLLPGHAGESLFTMEWFQAQYFEDDIERPQITNFLTCRFQDAYFDDRVSISMTGILETRNNGVILWPQIGYDFQNGFKVEFGYTAIDGQGEGDYQKDSIFYYYKDNDFITVNLRYAFP